jgi:hypothetical protein
MGREKGKDRDRGSPKVRLDSGKIVFDCRHRGPMQPGTQEK